ncbi:hypothetical protein FH972_022898 [Carpinus fangiana]|uniref:Uncharacterized protein n=1 Tax=Carpinus fangiana TaxID=176857 RepID=A0A5N6KU43_9ROSI|nr:hypothetical protein FH972_022898 [Carpinus fangiana]
MAYLQRYNQPLLALMLLHCLAWGPGPTSGGSPGTHCRSGSLKVKLTLCILLSFLPKNSPLFVTMMTQIKSIAILAFAAAAMAQKLDKPALTPDLDYLNQGNIDNHGPTQSTTAGYEAGQIPADCKDRAQAEGHDPADMEVTYVTYTDCADPWVFCRHKDSVPSLVDLQDMFGRVPVGMRDYVKHVMSFPGGQGAYNYGGDIVFFDTAGLTFDVWLHESAHSLDLQGAITGDSATTYSSTDNWVNNYNQDPNVADNYAQSNMVENFAQETVVAIYDKAVPGGFGGVQPSYNNLFHQYATVQGDAGAKIITGGTCNRALQPSGPVSISSTARRTTSAYERPEHTFSQKYSNLRAPNLKANTKDTCKIGHKH